MKGRQGCSRRTFTKTNRVQDEAENDSSSDEYLFHQVGNRSVDPANLQVQINDKRLTMEVDTGAALPIISEKTRKAVFPDKKLRPSKLILKTYTNEPLKVMGTINV